MLDIEEHVPGLDDVPSVKGFCQVGLLRLDVLEVEDGVVLEPRAHGAVQGGGPPVLVKPAANIRRCLQMNECYR